MVCGYPYHADVAAGSKCYLEVYRRQEMGGRRCTDGDEISAISLVMLSLQQYCIGREQHSSYARFDKCIDPVLTSQTGVGAAALVSV